MIYVDKVTGTWGDSSELLLVTQFENASDVLENLDNDSDIIDYGEAHGRTLDQYVSDCAPRAGAE